MNRTIPLGAEEEIKRLYNKEHKTYTEIGRIYNVKRQRIHQIVKGRPNKAKSRLTIPRKRKMKLDKKKKRV